MGALLRVWCWLTYRQPPSPRARHTDAALDRLRGYRPHTDDDRLRDWRDLHQTGRWPR